MKMSVGSRRAYVERLVVEKRRRSRDAAELNIGRGGRTVRLAKKFRTNSIGPPP